MRHRRRRMRYPFSNRVPLSLPRFHHLSYACEHSAAPLYTPFTEEDRLGGKTPLRGVRASGRDSQKDVDGEGRQLTHLFEFLPGLFLLALAGCSRVVQSVEAS